MMDVAAISRLFQRTDRELWVVTAADGSERGGLIATFVSHASIVTDMPRVLVGIARQHQTWQLIEQSNAFALQLIAVDQIDWVWRFGLQSGRDADKFDGLNTRRSELGNPILTDAAGWLDCRVETRMETGDRTVYLAEVVDGGVEADSKILTMQHLLRVAPPEKLQLMKAHRIDDSQTDATAIQNWRDSSHKMDH